MRSRVRVEQLGTNPTPDECPNMLFSFNDYFVCPEILAYRCVLLINGFKASPALQPWAEGDWFQTVLRNAYPSLSRLLEENHSFSDNNNSTTNSSTSNSYTEFSNAFSSTTFSTTGSNAESQEISHLFNICKSLIETLDTPGDNLHTFLGDIMRSSSTANSHTMHRFRVKTRILLQGFHVFVSHSSHSDDAKHECLLRTLWVLFWRCYQLLQVSARLCYNGDTTVRSWRHIPALVSGVLIRGIETPVSTFASIVSPIIATTRKRFAYRNRNGNKNRNRHRRMRTGDDDDTGNDSDDVDDYTDSEFSRINLSTECIPYALWLSNQLENVNYYRLASHNSLVVAAKQKKCQRQRSKSKRIDPCNVFDRISRDESTRSVYAQFGRMLRALRNFNYCELVNTFFEGVQQGNVLIQEYVYKYLSTLPRVTSVSGNSFTVDHRALEITVNNYDKMNEKYVTLKARLSTIFANIGSEEKINSLNIKATALLLQESESQSRFIIDSLVAHANNNISEKSYNCNDDDNDDDETKIIKLIRNIGALRNFMHKQQAALLSTKMILLLCRSWSQAYVEGYKVLTAEQLRAHTKFMRQKICHLCEPIRNLCTRLVEHLDAIYEDTSLVTLPIAIALSVLSHVENEVKQVLAESVTLVMERTKIAKDIETTLESRRSKLVASNKHDTNTVLENQGDNGGRNKNSVKHVLYS